MVKTTTQKVLVVLAFGVPFLLGIIAVCLAVSAWKDSSFDSQCKQTIGSYLGRTYTVHSRLLASYEIEYQYSVSGVSYTGRDAVSSDLPSQTDSPIVYYNPSNPEDSRLEKGKGNQTLIGVLVLFVFAVVFGVDIYKKASKVAKT